MSSPGTYALLLRLDAPQNVAVGALGSVHLPAGYYLYVGSAHGPGGLAARLARHRRRDGKRFHWHVDYVRAVARLVQIWSHPDERRQECEWAAAAAALPGARIPAPGFGASDCRCTSHFFYYPRRPEPSAFQRLTHAPVTCECVAESWSPDRIEARGDRVEQ
jgi:Uri superfamily endonuclease